MRRKTASAMGLLGFALASGLAAIRNVDLAAALYRAVLASLVMAIVGYVAGMIAEKAIQEAVDTKEPLRPKPTIGQEQETDATEQEEGK